MGVEYEPVVIIGFEFANQEEYESFCEKHSIDQDGEYFQDSRIVYGTFRVISGALNLWCGDDYAFGVILESGIPVEEILMISKIMQEKFPDNNPQFLLKQRVF